MIKWKSRLLTGHRIIDLLKKTKSKNSTQSKTSKRTLYQYFLKNSLQNLDFSVLCSPGQIHVIPVLYNTRACTQDILVNLQNLFPGTSHRILLTTVMKGKDPIECQTDEKIISMFSDLYSSLSPPPQSSTGKCCTKWQILCHCLLTWMSQLY